MANSSTSVSIPLVFNFTFFIIPVSFLPAHVNDKQRVRSHQLLLANTLAVCGRVCRRHAVVTPRQARHPETHQGQHRHTVPVPHCHRVSSHHPGHHSTNGHCHRSSYTPVRHTCVLLMC